MSLYPEYSPLVGVRFAGFHDADIVIRKGLMAARQPDFGHVAGHAVGL
jgi:hypothetical protein